MRTADVLRKEITEEIFDYSQITSVLSHYSKPRDVISKLLKSGDIIRIRKGLYVFKELSRRKPVSKELLANLIYGPSLISLDFVLSTAGLIPEFVPEITSVTTGRSRVFNTPMGRFSYRQLNQNRFIAGSEFIRTESGSYLSAKPLKALADKVWFDKRFKPTSQSSFEEYLLGDLRINETILKDYIRVKDLDEIDSSYSSRKISWLVIFLKRKFVASE